MNWDADNGREYMERNYSACSIGERSLFDYATGLEERVAALEHKLAALGAALANAILEAKS